MIALSNLDPSRFVIKYPDWQNKVNSLAQRAVKKMTDDSSAKIKITAKLYKMFLYKKMVILRDTETIRLKKIICSVVLLFSCRLIMLAVNLYLIMATSKIRMILGH